MKKRIRILFLVLAAAVVLTAAALAVEGAPAGSEGDPLVTLSYLSDVFTAQITELFQKDVEEQTAQVRDSLEERVAALEEAGVSAAEADSSAYRVETLTDGQTLICQRGAEIMLRIGSAVVTAEDVPGLVDTSTAENLNDGGSLLENHLYMVTINGHGVRAEGTAKLVVRGDYVIS